MKPPIPRVLIFAENASRRFGGEAVLPLHTYRVLRSRGADVWLLTHERCREELTAEFPNDDHVIFVSETASDRALERCAGKLPERLATFTFRQAARRRTQRAAIKIARQLIRDKNIQLVHQPMPVAPRDVSLIRGLGVPIVFGPFNGGMTFPPGFRATDGRASQTFVAAARRMTDAVHWLFPAKRQAAMLLVANDRTRAALPANVRGSVRTVVENGVELSIWKQPPHRPQKSPGEAMFAFVGRLVDWKAVDLLIEAFGQLAATLPASKLEIVGDGPMRAVLAAQAAALGLGDRIVFRGWMKQTDAAAVLATADAFVLPSLYECGGAVVLEAMAMGLPVIATAWGGPSDYVEDGKTGLLIPPKDREALVAGLADAMKRLANDPALRYEMGLAGRAGVERDFDWERKADRLIELYREAIDVHEGKGK